MPYKYKADRARQKRRWRKLQKYKKKSLEEMPVVVEHLPDTIEFSRGLRRLNDLSKERGEGQASS